MEIDAQHSPLDDLTDEEWSSDDSDEDTAETSPLPTEKALCTPPAQYDGALVAMVTMFKFILLLTRGAVGVQHWNHTASTLERAVACWRG